MGDKLHTWLLASAITFGALHEYTAACVFVVAAPLNIILSIWATRSDADA